MGKEVKGAGKMGNPYGEWKPFRHVLTGSGSGGTSDDVPFGPLDGDTYVEINELSYEDETSAVTTDIRVLILGHGIDIPVLGTDTPSGGTLYPMSYRKIHLSPGETLVARFTGATLGDVLRLYVGGKEWVGRKVE